MEQGPSSLKYRWAYGEKGGTVWSVLPAFLLPEGKPDNLHMPPCLLMRDYEVSILYSREQTCSSFLVKHLFNRSLLKAYGITSALVGLRFVEHVCKPRICSVRWREDRELWLTLEGPLEWGTQQWWPSFLEQGWCTLQWPPSFLPYGTRIRRGRSFLTPCYCGFSPGHRHFSSCYFSH